MSNGVTSVISAALPAAHLTQKRWVLSRGRQLPASGGRAPRCPHAAAGQPEGQPTCLGSESSPKFIFPSFSWKYLRRGEKKKKQPNKQHCHLRKNPVLSIKSPRSVNEPNPGHGDFLRIPMSQAMHTLKQPQGTTLDRKCVKQKTATKLTTLSGFPPVDKRENWSVRQDEFASFSQCPPTSVLSSPN